LTKNSKTKQPEIIIDTSTFFSALYNPWGNEALLFSLADNLFVFFTSLIMFYRNSGKFLKENISINI